MADRSGSGSGPGPTLLDDAHVAQAAQGVLVEHGTVVSLAKLLGLVNERLKGTGGGRRVGPERLRRLMAEAPFCQMELRTRTGPRRAMTRCPVCRQRLGRLRNQTLFGGEVVLTLRCTQCPYRTGRRRHVPTLYTFHLARHKDGPDSST